MNIKYDTLNNPYEPSAKLRHSVIPLNYCYTMVYSLFYRKVSSLPTAFLGKRARASVSSKKKLERLFTYDRDSVYSPVICRKEWSYYHTTAERKTGVF